MEENRNNVPNSRPVPPPPPPRPNFSAQQPAQPQQAQVNSRPVSSQKNSYVQTQPVGNQKLSNNLNDKREQKEIAEIERIKGKSGSKFLTALYWISFVLALGAIGLLIYLLIR